MEKSYVDITMRSSVESASCARYSRCMAGFNAMSRERSSRSAVRTAQGAHRAPIGWQAIATAASGSREIVVRWALPANM